MKNLSSSIIYNIYPTSFYDSNGDGIGDLNGIAQKLEYVAQLADIIWINPIFKSPFCDGGYDVEDYYKIDKRFGDMSNLEALLKKAHRLGLRVLLDLVVGHTSDKHKWFKESAKVMPNAHSDYYIWTDGVFAECPYSSVRGRYKKNGNYLTNFFYMQPSINFGFAKKTLPWQMSYKSEQCQVLHKEVEDVIRFYLNKGVDGFRVDMANSIVKDDTDGDCSCEVWRKIFDNVRHDFTDALFVSEWGQPKFAVPKGTFDIDFITHCYSEGYNNLFRKESGTNVFNSEGESFFRTDGKGEAQTFFDYFIENLQAVSSKGYISVPTGNHDLPRISMRRTDDEIKLVYAFIMALPCVPLFYYGDEIGMSFTKLTSKDGGYIRTGSRTPMQWNGNKNAGFTTSDKPYLPIPKDYNQKNVEQNQNNENSILNFVRKISNLKRSTPLLSADANFEVISNTYPLIIKRKSGDKELIVAINPSQNSFTINEPYAKILLSQNITISDNKITLPSTSFVYLERLV